MEECKYYDAVLSVVDDLLETESRLNYYDELDWTKLKEVYEGIGRLRQESHGTVARYATFRILEARGVVLINNIKRRLHDLGGIAYDD